MSTPAQLSVTLTMIREKLKSAQEYSDYGTQLREEALAMIPQYMPTGSIVVSANGTRSVVCGYKNDLVAFCDVNSTNSGWTHWNNIKPLSIAEATK